VNKKTWKILLHLWCTQSYSHCHCHRRPAAKAIILGA